MSLLSRFQKNFSSTSISGTSSSGRLNAAAVAFSLITLLSLFLIPLPPALLDLLLVLNIVLALVLLLRGVFLGESTKLFAFPSILLLATLFRLALNVSSTRLILLQGDQSSAAAGKVIEAFGNFVVQGDFIVGAIIFSVIAVVNFVVIAKGSARVAEVSARFTLDALPGKQLAIDSELRSQSITAEEAARRRDTLNQESQFYGAMDGAMKFVQGDAIAGFVITFINLIGGVGLGLQRGMSFPDALNTFGLLTIGDGLVSIIPSLLVSICAGVIVTHVAGSKKSSSGAQVVEQLLGEPEAIGIAGVVTIILGVATNLPVFPFLAIGIPAVIWSFMRRGGPDSPGQKLATGSASVLQTERAGLPASDSLLGIEDFYSVRPLLLELPDSVHQIVSVNVAEHYETLREQIFQRKGIILPALRIEKSGALSDTQFSLSINERPRVSGQLYPGLYYVEVSPRQLQALGVKVEGLGSSPTDSRAISWVRVEKEELPSFEKLGISLHSSASYLAKEVVGVALNNIEELFGLSDVNNLVSQLRERHPKLVEEVIDKEVLNLAEVSEVLRRLIREQISIRSLRRIFEGILEYRALSNVQEDYDRSEWIDDVHDYLRKILAESILSEVTTDDGRLRAFLLSSELENEFRSAVSMWDNYRSRLPLSPELEQGLRDKFEMLFRPVIDRGSLPVVLVCANDIRKAVNAFLGSFFGRRQAYLTLSFDELGHTYKPEPVGMIDI